MLQSRTIREGSLGLFALIGLVIFGGLTIWLRGGGWGEQSYRFTVEFSDVGGLQVGAPVRYRGMNVGRLISLTPSGSGVDAILEINSSSLRIPRDSTVRTNRYGLIGEASIDISPNSPLTQETQAMNPLSPDCDPNSLICNNSRIQGDEGAQLVTTLTELSRRLSDPKFFNSLETALINTGQAAKKITAVGDDVSTLSRTAKREISVLSRDFSRTSLALTRTANDASVLAGNANTVLTENRQNIAKTFENTNQLITNANQLLLDNRKQIESTIVGVKQMSQKLELLATNMNETALRLNSTLDAADSKQIMQDLETLMANAAEISANLRQVSETLNDPTTMITLQQTLDSARVTFENTQKLTSDLDELIGDPQFRNQIRILINGLTNLVSSTEQLNQQIETVHRLENSMEELAKKVEHYQQLTKFEIPISQEQVNLQLSKGNMPPSPVLKKPEIKKY